ncbi:ABC transporter permease [Leucobacter sp. UCMA 4100]|uniref:ABC transporter permease n=1 Tax=Leucobacter sp. UCMA 4100 TaxID=2810534 RepID=UPI0022EA4D25|nr:ABC transporter permease [Leucobacter sp. UCMA 4100]MDA3146485.1 ABC transporter permease [Leucobacter sp. UCMA 4100]
MRPLGNATQFRQLCLAFGREALRDKRAMLTMLFTFAGALVAITLCDVVLAVGHSETAGSAHLPTLGIVRASLPTLALIGCCSLAFVTTATPLVTYRATGVLQHLSTTPIRSVPLVTAHLVARLPVSAVQVALIVGLALGFATPSPAALSRFTLVLSAGFAFFLSLGCLIGARFRSPERTMGFALIATMLVIATSGAAVPLALLPQPLANVFTWLPTAFFVNALGAELATPTVEASAASPLLALAFVAAAAAVLSIAAATLHCFPGKNQ